MTQQATQTLTVVVTGALIEKGRGVTWVGAQAVAGEAICGIADHRATIGDALRVITGVSADADAGAAINGVERRLATDANGRLIPWAAGIVAARLVPKTGNTAVGLGDTVEVAPVWS